MHGDPGLRGTVGCETLSTLGGVDARSVDDAAAGSLLDELRGFMLHAEEHSRQTHADHPVPFLQGIVLNRREAPDAGIVEGDIQPSKAGYGLSHQRLYSVFVAHVHGHAVD